MLTYEGDSKLAELLDAAAEAGEPLRVVVSGTAYEIVVNMREKRPDLWADYDPEAALEALEHSTGVFGGIDADALIAELKAEREQGDLGSAD